MKRTLGLLLLALGCDGGTHEPPGGKPSGPWIGLKAALEHPGAVDAWTISGDPTKNREHFDYAESSKRILVDSEAAAALSTILSDPKSFSNDPKPCVPVPGVKVRFSRANLEPIWLFFCLDCEELFVYEGALFREHKEIDPSTKALIVLLKRIFPKESSIQNLR